MSHCLLFIVSAVTHQSRKISCCEPFQSSPASHLSTALAVDWRGAHMIHVT